MRISVKADVTRAIKQLGPELKDRVYRAASAALNRVANSANTLARREIVIRTGYKSGFIRREVYVSLKASRVNLTARIAVTRRKGARVLNLIETVKQSKRNVKAFRKKVKRGKDKGAYLYAGVEALRAGRPAIFPGTFIIPGKGSGKMLVFSRKSKSRAGGSNLKFEPGPSITRAFSMGLTQKKLLALVKDRWSLEFQRALKVFAGS